MIAPGRILLTGCSGGGKSTLLDALASLGHLTVAEPGRRIVAAARAGTGAALPWVDMTAFARAALAMARADLAGVADHPGPVFFDRGAVDAAVALAHASGIPLGDILGPDRAYADTVFIAPPWPEIYARDADRRHDLPKAIAEYQRLTEAVRALGYRGIELPRTSVAERAAFVLRTVGPG